MDPRRAFVVIGCCCLLQTGSSHECEIPARFHGNFFTSDVQYFDQIQVNATHVTSKLKEEADNRGSRSSQPEWNFECQDSETAADVDAGGYGRIQASLKVRNPSGSTCIQLTNLTPESNILQLSKYSLEDDQQTCGDLMTTVEIQNALLFNTQPSRSKCPGPFHLKQFFSYRGEMGDKTVECYSETNAFHPVEEGTGIVMQWGICNDTELNIGPQDANVTVDCIGVWQDANGGAMWGISTNDEAAPLLHRFQCFWHDNGRYKLSLTTEDCSRKPAERNAYASFSVARAGAVAPHATILPFLLGMIYVFLRM